MNPERFYETIVEPTLQFMKCVSIIPSDQARVMLMAIAGQESDWRSRRQIGGPARSYWQFEQGGGVVDVLQRAPGKIVTICRELDIPSNNAATLFEAMAWNDMLACSMARLLLFIDLMPLPELGKEETAWQYYLRNWRPGAPHRDKWTEAYATAMDIVQRLGPAQKDLPL